MRYSYVLLAALGLLTACGGSKQQPLCEPVTLPLVQFTANEVTLREGSDFAVRQQWDRNFLLSLDVERLLYFFVDPPHRQHLEPYGSWESLDLKGHTLGHYLTALSMLYAQQGDAEVKQRLDRVVEGMAECEQRLGTGLITAFRLDLLDECETQGTGWAPYYTLHKLLQGLLDAYTYGRNDHALELAVGMGNHSYDRMMSIRERGIDWEHNLDIMEVGGFGESMLNLYALTHEPKHLEVARFFHQRSKLEPAAEGRDVLHDPAHLAQHRSRRTPNDDALHNMHHCNATIPQFLAAARDFELTGDSLYWRAADHFWHFVTEHRTYSNGTTGNFEHWNYGPDSLSQELDYRAGETCCTYNLIKLSNELFRLHPQADYAAYVERALVNDILGTIYPETADFVYFHTQKPGSHKTYGVNDQCFWCCTGSGMENPQRYVESIYFADSTHLYVNLPIASNLDWKQRGIRLHLESDYPDPGPRTLTIDEGAGHFVLCYRFPQWQVEQYRVTVNDRPYPVKPEQGYLCIERDWKAGDRVSIHTPYALYFEPLADDPSYVSLLYGPLVLAADLGQVDSALVHVTNNFYGGVPELWLASDSVPVLDCSRSRLEQSFYPSEEGYPVRTSATTDGQTLEFVPLYRITDHRFAAYLRNVNTL